MIALLFYLFGIIMGLYLDGIVPFLCLGLIILFVTIEKKKKILIIIIGLSILLGIGRVWIEKRKYNNLGNLEDYSGNGIIVGVEKSTNYKNLYIVKENNVKLKLYTDKKIDLNYGDIIYFEGDFSIPEEARNEYGFDNRNYLKQKKIGGYLFANSVEKNGTNYFYKLLSIKKWIRDYIDNSFSDEASGFINGILLADSSEIDYKIKENFQKSSLLHILAVSGMHINIIENILNRVFDKIKIHKKKAKIIIIILLSIYMLIIGSPVSCMRAVFMEFLECIAFLRNQKSDFERNIIISLVAICFINPYNVLNVGLWLSYGGTIGIVYLSKFIKKRINKKIKLNLFISDNLATSLSVQVVILPIIIYYFNNISISGILSNLVVTPLIEPLMYLIIISICLNFSPLVNFFIKVLYKEIEYIAKIKWFRFYVARPHFIFVVFYYFVLFFIIYKMKKNFVKNYRILYRFKNIFIVLIIILFISNKLYLAIPSRYLEYDFIDVGQGDCSLIITPNHKSILIDGGDNKDFDNGQKTILPILINKHIGQIDYLFISHFDSDHVGGLFTILKEYRVKNVIISKQAENSDNFKEFMRILNSKKIHTIIVSKGNRINVEKNIYIDILWPDEKNMINENCLNNNSIVCMIHYCSTSILFTGDIENEAEKIIVENYTTALDSDIIKVPHHGSTTSSTEEFVKAISPKIALIGVGKNNKFGHPNDEIVERYENMRNKNISYRSNGRNYIKDK